MADKSDTRGGDGELLEAPDELSAHACGSSDAVVVEFGPAEAEAVVVVVVVATAGRREGGIIIITLLYE